MVEERARQATSWPCGASAHRWLVLLCLWVFHVCEVRVRCLLVAGGKTAPPTNPVVVIT